MILQEGKGFRLETAHTSYWFRVTPFGHLEHIWYGPKLKVSAAKMYRGESGGAEIHAELYTDAHTDVDTEMNRALWDALSLKRTIAPGSSVIYDESDPLYCMNVLPQEWSTQGRGDYRETPCELTMPDGTVIHDFQYKGRKIVEGTCGPETLPGAYVENGAEKALDGGVQTLVIYLQDSLQKVYLTLYYTVYEESDVITRRVVLRNEEEQPLTIHRLLSSMMDIPDRHYRMLTFDGTWIREAHRHETWLEAGSHVNQSTTGASSNFHNPGFLLAEELADEDHGCVYGCNLIYSGNLLSEK